MQAKLKEKEEREALRPACNILYAVYTANH